MPQIFLRDLKIFNYFREFIKKLYKLIYAAPHLIYPVFNRTSLRGTNSNIKEVPTTTILLSCVICQDPGAEGKSVLHVPLGTLAAVVKVYF